MPQPDNEEDYPNNLSAAESFVYVQTPVIHDAPHIFVRPAETLRSHQRVQAQNSVPFPPPTRARDMVMFPCLVSLEPDASSSELIHMPTTITVSTGPPRNIENIAIDPPAKQESDLPHHFILETTFVPQALRGEPSIARLLMVRREYDKQLAGTDVGDPMTFGLWEVRQNIDEDLAELVEQYTVVDELERQIDTCHDHPPSAQQGLRVDEYDSREDTSYRDDCRDYDPLGKSLVECLSRSSSNLPVKNRYACGTHGLCGHGEHV